VQERLNENGADLTSGVGLTQIIPFRNGNSLTTITLGLAML